MLGLKNINRVSRPLFFCHKVAPPLLCLVTAGQRYLVIPAWKSESFGWNSRASVKIFHKHATGNIRKEFSLAID